MLPPVLEIYLVWHPGDRHDARPVAQSIIEHFHGPSFAGLIGGAIEGYVRSEGWETPRGAPRPIPFPGSPPPNDVAPAELVVVVPIMGVELSAAVENDESPWGAYLQAAMDARRQAPDRVGVYPTSLEGHRIPTNCRLRKLLGSIQQLGAPSPHAPAEPMNVIRCRDLAQAITSLANGTRDGAARLKVFLSHTKREGGEETGRVGELIARAHEVIANGRLAHFFDAHDLLPGGDWDETLRTEAASSALLCLRTDLYATREWCQREVRIAKQAGMPVVIIDALASGEERGSFLMDHRPRVSARKGENGWDLAAMRRGVNILVDECLKRALWRRQEQLAQAYPRLSVSWWAPHAPEPTTLVDWLTGQRARNELPDAGPIRILHPDPPLGADELMVLDAIAELSGLAGRLEIMTPRMLAARGG